MLNILPNNIYISYAKISLLNIAATKLMNSCGVDYLIITDFYVLLRKI